MPDPIHITPTPWPDVQRQPLFATLLAFLLIGIIAWVALAVVTKARQLQTLPPTPRQLTAEGTGKIRATPDIATVSTGFVVQGASVRTVQSEANQKMAALIAAVKALGIPAADVQTSEFSIQPQYVYEEKRGPRITGYEARQSVEVRIRDLARIDAVLDAAGGAGATNIGGLQFTIDDPDRLRSTAREEAIREARARAEEIAQHLGVRLGRLVAFQEDGSGGPPTPIYTLRDLSVEATGGAAPAVERGSTEVTATVHVTYELQ